MATKTVGEALKHVADHPDPGPTAPIDKPMHELIARTLFEIANSPDAKVRGSMARATKAQKIIFDRLVGTRRPGSRPAARKDESIEFVDLTAGVLEL